MGLTHVVIYTNSLLASQWFQKVIKPPWHLLAWWRKIHEEVHLDNFQIKHVYREGNRAVDHLARLGIKFKSDGAANCSTDKTLRQITLGDRLQIPNIRLPS
ncbi:hypothetical protein FRX31_008326 [Thalictrum thalictroides]|uniref:Uncharacterized protein n=1 Tax=Thalictrum thalictroides TaxID=46969 RepID=A0A7J6WYU4_THATH|nr:hypothetical protein FRX31_008326 [Thalictrum thalictroides]